MHRQSLLTNDTAYGKSQQQGRLHDRRGSKKPEKPHGQGTSRWAIGPGGRREKAAQKAAAQTAQQQQVQQMQQQMQQMQQMQAQMQAQMQQQQMQMQQQQRQHELAMAQMRSAVDVVGEENATFALQHAQALGNVGRVSEEAEEAAVDASGDQTMGDEQQDQLDFGEDF